MLETLVIIIFYTAALYILQNVSDFSTDIFRKCYYCVIPWLTGIFFSLRQLNIQTFLNIILKASKSTVQICFWKAHVRRKCDFRNSYQLNSIQNFLRVTYNLQQKKEMVGKNASL